MNQIHVYTFRQPTINTPFHQIKIVGNLANVEKFMQHLCGPEWKDRYELRTHYTRRDPAHA